METVIDCIMEYLQLLIDNKVVQFVTAFVVICAIFLLLSCADNSVITKLSLESVSIDQERDIFAVIGDPAIEDVQKVSLSYAKTRASYVALYNLVYDKVNDFRLWKELSFMERSILTRVHKDIDTLDKRVIEAYTGIVSANSLKKDINSALEIFSFGVGKIIPILAIL